MSEQLELYDNGEYEAFVEKFKPKLTTDDCYTPAPVYDAVADWVAKEYGLDRETFVRPFWPGGDYERFEYPEGCVVVDNPPFSIFTQIVRWYTARGIRFFLFGPHLTLFNPLHYSRTIGAIVADADIIYENGAKVNTGFVTNLEAVIRTAPDLVQAIEAAQKTAAVRLPQYDYPPNVVTAARLGKIANVPLRIPRQATHFTRALDSQQERKKKLFGTGFLISNAAAAEKAAAEKAAAEKVSIWTLSERELAIIAELDKKEGKHEE